MKRLALLFGLAAATSASCVIKPCSGKCVSAIRESPVIGESFCSAFLSLEPATTTVTEIDYATSTRTSTETVTSVLVFESTTTVLAESTTVFLKREAASASVSPAETISSACSFAASRISSACRCFLGSAIQASTYTVTEASTSTEVHEERVTSTETTVTSAVVTVSATPTFTVPANPVLNGGFESYQNTSPLSFDTWGNTTGSTGGVVEVIRGVNPCTPGPVCAGGSTIARVYPPVSVGGYVALEQTFVARPSTTYNFSLIFRCLNYDSQTHVAVWYGGNKIGSSSACTPSSAFSIGGPLQFTTDATGVGKIEVRFVNGSGKQYLYFYTDAFIATVA